MHCLSSHSVFCFHVRWNICSVQIILSHYTSESWFVLWCEKYSFTTFFFFFLKKSQSSRKVFHLFQINCFLFPTFAFNNEQPFICWYIFVCFACSAQQFKNGTSLYPRIHHAYFTETKHNWTNLIFLPKQSSLYSIPGISVVFIHIHSEEYSQATSQAARLLF